MPGAVGAPDTPGPFPIEPIMADTIPVECPGCKKVIKAPAALKGKKIKCKSCNQAFTVGDAVRRSDEEWGEVAAYGVTAEKDKLHCAFCAHDMEDGQVICLHCGYNMQTRKRLETRVLEATGVEDYITYLMPGIIYAIIVLIMIGVIIWIWVDYPWDWPEKPESIQVYVTVACGFVIWGAGVPAFKRLVLRPHPPEREKTEHKKN